MESVKGTQGYESSIETFADASFTLDFKVINEEFLPFLPKPNSLVLDLGCGVGQNAFALSEQGFKVVAVEPLDSFLNLAKVAYASSGITWIQDSLPELTKLSPYNGKVSFILLDGVWHHLKPEERLKAIFKIKLLLNEDGYCAISLRNGPAGVGSYVFSTSTEEVLCMAEKAGLACSVISKDQASKMKNKESVVWSRVVIKHKYCNAS